MVYPMVCVFLSFYRRFPSIAEFRRHSHGHEVREEPDTASILLKN